MEFDPIPGYSSHLPHASVSRYNTTMMWVGISRSSDGAYSWTDGRDISGAWTGTITIDIADHGRGCVAVDMTDVDSVRGIALSLKDCSTTELSYLCMVDTGE